MGQLGGASWPDELRVGTCTKQGRGNPRRAGAPGWKAGRYCEAAAISRTQSANPRGARRGFIACSYRGPRPGRTRVSETLASINDADQKIISPQFRVGHVRD